MKSKEEIATLLEGLGKAWPEDNSIVEGVMRKIESAPVRPKLSKQMRIIMKSVIAIAVSAAIIAVIWWGVIDNHKSLYAQVMDAVQKAQTLHLIVYVQPKSVTEPQKSMEKWYASDVGFRDEFSKDHIVIGNNEFVWWYNKKTKTAVRSKSYGIYGIDKVNSPIFKVMDQLVQQLQGDYERYPAGDKEIDGVPCKAYKLNNFVGLEEKHKADAKSGLRQLLIYLDQHPRVVEQITQVNENGRWKTQLDIYTKYDELLDPSLFEPVFDKDVKIIDADKSFGEFTDLNSAICTEEHDGIIIGIHRLERFEDGGVMFASSVRGSESTLKKYLLIVREALNFDNYLIDGPASNQSPTYKGADGIYIKLAYAYHQGIDIGWWAFIPDLKKQDFYETALGKIKLNISVCPEGKFRESLTEKQIEFFDHGWYVAVDAPSTDKISTLEEITKVVAADLETLRGIPFRSLTFSGNDHKTETGEESNKKSAGKNAENNVRDLKWLYERDINFQIDGKYNQSNIKEIKKWMTSGRDSIFLSFNPEVSDATIQRVTKRESVTELYLQDTRITDDGLKHLNVLKKLESLNLAETSITDEGLRHLMGISSLKHLNLMNTKVTAEGVAMLKKALPNVEMQWKADGKQK
jgi:outer membrane lipoprotein-sorting protein